MQMVSGEKFLCLWRREKKTIALQGAVFDESYPVIAVAFICFCGVGQENTKILK